MNEEKPHKNNSFKEIVGNKAKRRIQAQGKQKSVWAGLGLFGMIGWSIAVPTLLGAALGVWLDNNYKEDFSWTLSLLVAGLMLGCGIAWKWIQKEDKEIHKEKKDGNK